MAEPFIQLTGISKSFGGLRALKEVSFDVRPGEVHALLGENGAGKSTLIKIMAGVLAPDEGEIAVEGTPVRFASPREAHRLGIATVHQELLLFPELTVAENIFLGQAPRTSWGGLDWPRMRERAKALLVSLDTHELDVNAKVGSLSVANRQRVEIARALAQNARLVIMDEPTAALGVKESRKVLELMLDVKRRGLPIILISHNMPHVFEVADRIHIHRLGRRIAVIEPSKFSMSDAVAIMTGAMKPPETMVN